MPPNIIRAENGEKKGGVGTKKFSSPEEKKETSDVVFDGLMEYLFDEVVFTTLPFSDLGIQPTVVTISGVDYFIPRIDTRAGTTSTANYGKNSRLIDTSSGKLLRPDRSSRFRCHFYLRNPFQTDGYILSPVAYNSSALPTNLTDMSIFESYFGIKFIQGKIFIVAKEAGKGKSENLYPTNITLEMDDALFSKTYTLEIKYNVRTAEVIINNVSYGTFGADMVASLPTPITFYPFFSPARSTNGVLVNIVSENIQFIQSKK